MARTYRVAVVGFGVAGATAAYLLARAGHGVDLFERAPVVGPVGSGILLQPSGQMVLEKLGLLDEVAAQAEPIAELHAVQPHGGTLVHLPYGDFERGLHAYGVHRGVLFSALHRTVLSQKVGVHLGREVHGRSRDGDATFLHDSGGERHGPYDFVVAADGSRSRLRHASKLPWWREEYAYGATWAVGPCSAVRGQLRQVVHGTRVLIGLLPVGGGRCCLYGSLRRDQKDAVWRRGFAAWRDGVLRLCPLAEELFMEVRDFDRVAFTPYQHVWMRRWHDAGAVFIGDAAHAMSPHLGQGINLALMDAYRLAEAVAETDSPQAAFRAYTRKRRGHLYYYSLITYLLTPFFQSDGRVRGWGRDVALPLMTRAPWLRRQMIMTMAGVKSGFFGGRFRL
jgi:2-polyprenyl-6-methoxyphenol hydroxylase-like FAD-dependent oxidoreductase